MTNTKAKLPDVPAPDGYNWIAYATKRTDETRTLGTCHLVPDAVGYPEHKLGGYDIMAVCNMKPAQGWDHITDAVPHHAARCKACLRMVKRLSRRPEQKT